jgi:hypothetical protein
MATSALSRAARGSPAGRTGPACTAVGVAAVLASASVIGSECRTGADHGGQA